MLRAAQQSLRRPLGTAASRLRCPPPGFVAHPRWARSFSDEEEEKPARKFGDNRMYMGNNMTPRFVSDEARRPAPPPSDASVQLAASLAAEGADAFRLATALVAHFGTEAHSEDRFSAVDGAAFRALLGEACPEEAPRADAVFEAVSSGGGGLLEADDLLALLRAGLAMDAPQFEPMVWEEQFETIGKLDGDHVEFFDLINGVMASVREGPISGVRTSMAACLEHCEPHFAMEIETLRKCGSYEKWLCSYHELIHKMFVDEVKGYREGLAADNASAVCDLASGYSIGYMKEWMLYHMVWVDRPCIPHLEEAGFA